MNLARRTCQLAVLLLLSSQPILAQGVFTAATCNVADVNKVINGPTHVAIDGDTIQIPNGSCTWNSGINTTKQIWIRAQNYTPTSGGATSRNVNITNASTVPLFTMQTGNLFHVRITGIAFHESLANGSDCNTFVAGCANHINITGSGTMVAIIDDDYFELSGKFGSSNSIDELVWNSVGGLMFNDYLTGIGTCSDGSVGGCNASGSFLLKPFGPAWNSSSTMGMKDCGTSAPHSNAACTSPGNCANGDGACNVYLEDSTVVIPPNFPDDDDGGRLVIRHCTLDGISGGSHGYTSQFGGRFFEYYNNTITNTHANRNVSSRYYWARGGTGVMHDNAVTYQNQGFGTPHLWEGIVECIQNTSHGTCTAGQVPNANSVGGPAPQIGSTGFYQWETGTGWDGGYAVDPVYLWNNCLSGHTAPCAGDSTWANDSPGFIVQNGNVFVDSGPKPGYTPYTYPHPLRQGVGSGSVAPPAGLTAAVQ